MSSGTSVVVREEGGEADRPTARRAPGRRRSRARRSRRCDTSWSESLDREEPVVRGTLVTARRKSAPPSAAMPPARANARSFTRVGATRVAGGGVRVVAHADGGAADAGAAQPGDDDQRRPRARPARRSSRCAATTRSSPKNVRARERHRGAELPPERIGRRYRYCCAASAERERAHREQQPADTQRADADERGEAAR